MNQALPAHEALIVTTRGGAPENLHWGSVAVVDVDGHRRAWAGAPDVATFARSTLKPFQALPFIRAGGPARFGWRRGETAMLCASHRAEPFHLAIVEHMLASSGHRVDDLGCGAHVPMDAGTGCQPAPPGSAWSALHNNCSGKHAGFLASCRLHGWDGADYLDAAHPLQAGIREAIGEFMRIDVETAPRGIDGCSAPIYALPLHSLAHAFARLAAGADGSVVLRDAMLAEPRLISGTDRFDLLLADYGAGDWVVKGGADGLQLLASVSRGVAVAVKMADGNLRALNAAVIDVLRQLGWLARPLPPALAVHDTPAIRNWRGTQTGDVRSCIRLQRG